MAYAEPLKTKSSIEVAAALDKIIASIPITPRKLMVDAGKNFLDPLMQFIVLL